MTPLAGPALRQATVDDADRIADLLIEAKDDIPLVIDPETQRDRLIAVVRDDHIANGWVTAVGGTVTAVMIMDPGEHELLYLVTDAQHRRAGAGRMLIDQAKRIAASEGWEWLMVKTDPPNEPIRVVLGREGLCRDGEIKTEVRTWHRWIWRPS